MRKLILSLIIVAVASTGTAGMKAHVGYDKDVDFSTVTGTGYDVYYGSAINNHIKCTAEGIGVRRISGDSKVIITINDRIDTVA